MDCYKCSYKRLCRDLPMDLSCDDVQNIARDGGPEPPKEEAE